MIGAFLHGLESIFAWLIEASWQASVLAALVLLLQVMLRGRLNPRWHHALWLLVIARLLLPFLPESALSLFQFAPSPPPVVTETVTEPIFHAPIAPMVVGQAPVPARSVAYPVSFFTVLALVWLIGAVTLLVLTWQVNRRFARHVAAAPQIIDPRLLQLAEAAQQELATHRRPCLIESGQVQSPAIMGLLRPTLILPKNVRDRFDDDELRFIFLHEFAHLKRGDLFLQWLVAMLQILHWFNPVLWYAFRRMRADREPATDALVLSRTGEEHKESYGQVLVKLLEHYHERHSLPTLVGILEDKDQFKRRFSQIARFARGAYGWSLLGVLLVAILTVLCLTKAKPIDNASAKADVAKQATDPFPPSEDARDLDMLKSDLLKAMQDADARRVLLDSIKDLPDEQFLATLAGLGRSNPSITALQKEIADKNADIASLLTSGFTEDHPRIVAQRAEIAVKQKQLKDAIAGLRRAVAIDSQIADSRLTALNEEMAKAPASETTVAMVDAQAKSSPGQKLDDLMENLQQAKEDSDARRVLVNSVKDQPDEQFLATLAGLGRSDPSITALQKEIADKNADIASLLNSGVGSDNPRVMSARAGLAVKQQQMKDLIAGVRRAMAINQQMADSRVSLISKQLEAQVAKVQPDQATEPTSASVTSTATAKVGGSTNSPNIAIGMKIMEISVDLYQANKAKVDALVEKADINSLNKMEGVSLLAAPIVTTLPGMKANIDIVRKYPYPIKFDPAMRVSNSGGATVTVPTTPTDFVTKDVGVSAEITPTINASDSPDPGKIVLNGKFTVTDFAGFTNSNLVGTSITPSFNTSESLFLEALDNNQLKGIWIPGEHIARQNPTAANITPDWQKIAPMIKVRYILFVSASLVK